MIPLRIRLEDYSQYYFSNMNIKQRWSTTHRNSNTLHETTTKLLLYLYIGQSIGSYIYIISYSVLWCFYMYLITFLMFRTTTILLSSVNFATQNNNNTRCYFSKEWNKFKTLIRYT